jgi:hypothetical protein
MLKFITVLDLFTWKDKKKTGVILATVNMFFILILQFSYSVLSLTLLFLFFSGLLGMALNLLYRATTNDPVSPATPATTKDEATAVDEDDAYEYVSGETVQDIVLWIYKTSLRVQHIAFDILSWQDARLTVKVLIGACVASVLSCILGDIVLLWLVINVALAYPLALQKKRAEIEGLVKLVDSKIEEIVYKIPMIKGIENKRKSTISSSWGGESKKDK